MLYEENQSRFKLCALCNNRIEKDNVVCKEHMPYMELYRNELWFQDMVRAQQRQYEIDVEEFRFLKGNQLPSIAQKQSRTRGKQLTNSIKAQIIELYKAGIGDRRIAKRLGLSYKTVNTFLWRYRKSQNALQLCI